VSGGVEGSTLRDDVDGLGRSTLTSRMGHSFTCRSRPRTRS
jgi:hypothetical protein